MTCVPPDIVSLRRKSAAATEELGQRLAASMQPGDVVTLEGPLGSGKTTLARGICRGLGVPDDDISSPTFVLLQIYQGRLPIYHFDLYRLNRREELHPIGAEDYLWGDGVALVEWPGLAQALLPPTRLEIALTLADDREEERILSLRGLGAWRQRLLAADLGDR